MLRKLFLLYIDLFTISMTANSGYAMLGVIRNRFVNRYGWIKEEEMDDLIALAQSSPGPIAVNSAVLAGYRIAGTTGSFVAVCAVITPPFLMMVLVTLFYDRIVADRRVRIFIDGMQAGVCALLADIVIGMFSNIAKKKQVIYYVFMVLSFLYVRLGDLSIFWLALVFIGAGLFKALMMKRTVKDDA